MKQHHDIQEIKQVIERSLAMRERYFLTKSLMDWLAAAAGLAVLSPLMLLIALAVKLTSRGPVFYRQARVGFNNNVFMIYKFRTMFVDAEKHGAQWARRNDPRCTRLGAFLRRTHLDELPQLINVLKGEMSLVGPRPERPIFVSQLSQEIEGYPLRLRVKPGITGLAQVCQGPDQSVDDVRSKLGYDLRYMQACGLWMDIRIIGDTFWGLLTGRASQIQTQEETVRRTV